MANLPFNPDLDKITERELVPNIYARLKLGDTIYRPNRDGKVQLLNEDTSVLQLTQQIINILPLKLVKHIPDGVVVDIWPISRSSKDRYMEYGNRKFELIAAYLERSGIDITSLFTTEYINSGTRFTITFDDLTTSTDNIIAYLREIN